MREPNGSRMICADAEVGFGNEAGVLFRPHGFARVARCRAFRIRWNLTLLSYRMQELVLREEGETT